MSAVISIYADDVRSGDELLVGPQGFREDTNPTILEIVARPRDLSSAYGYVYDVTLTDDSGARTVVVWCSHSRVTVFRRSA